MNIKTPIGITVALAIAGIAAACSSSPSTVSGTEHVTGSLTGAAAQRVLASPNANPVFTLHWSGPVTATGTFNGAGTGPNKGQHHTFKTSAGNMYAVVSGKPTNHQAVSVAACTFTFSTTVPYRVAGGTGKFTGGTGHGVITVKFSGTGPRLANGKCNTANNVPPVSGSVTLTGSGLLTVRG